VSIREVVGGKGNNVARALRRLGQHPRPVTFLGGPIGQHCATLLRDDDGLDPLVIESAAPTRVILTVRTEATALQTAFFDPDPTITSADAESMLLRIEEALDGDIAALCLSGSSPSPPAHGLYSEVISLAQARRIPAFLDTYGPALAAIWGFWPTSIQVNRREAAAHLGKPSCSDQDIDVLLKNWARHGVACGIVTDGPNPVAIQYVGHRYRAHPPRIHVVNPIGSGDSLLAGLVDGWLRGLEPEPLLRHALACGVANALAWDAGAIDPAQVAGAADQIEIVALGPARD
jgi:fructose-1-phosphate kinase PfkB-like protein